MSRFVHEQAAVRVVFGAGTLVDVAAEAAALGGYRVLLIADPAAARAAEVVADGLGERLAARIDEVVQHVPEPVAAAAVDTARAADADLLLAVGGGSATGLAKAVARELGTPILAVPTTYAGSEMTPIWGLTGETGKTTGRDPRVRPRAVVYDPELTVSMPADLTATSGMNALAHCVEALYAPDASPITGLVAEEGARALAGALPSCVDSPTDPAARAGALYGAWLAGWSLGNATMGLHHKLCHVLGGLYDLPHAPTHSAVLPYAVAYQRGQFAKAGTAASHASGPSQGADRALGRVAAALSGDDAAAAIWDLATRLGAPTSLAAVGLPAEAVDRVVEAVLASPPANPRPLAREPLRELMLAALAGERPAP